VNKKIRLGIASIVGLVVVGAAVYLAMILAGNRPGSAQAGPGYEVVLPAEWPARQSDLEGLAVEVKDTSLFISPVFKRTDSQADYPDVEVVVTTTTKIFLDETDRQHPDIVDGKFYFVIKPFALAQIQAGYVINVWGNRRGDRLIADTIIIYVIPSNDTR
jgi:hypothetical protein